MPHYFLLHFFCKFRPILYQVPFISTPIFVSHVQEQAVVGMDLIIHMKAWNVIKLDDNYAAKKAPSSLNDQSTHKTCKLSLAPQTCLDLLGSLKDRREETWKMLSTWTSYRNNKNYRQSIMTKGLVEPKRLSIWTPNYLQLERKQLLVSSFQSYFILVKSSCV